MCCSMREEHAQRRQTTVGRAAWQSRGGVAEVVVANPSEDHEQAVTIDWRAGAQPDTPYARRLRGALVSEVLSSAASVPAVVPQVRQPCSAWRFTPRADVQEHHSGSGGSRRHGKQELGGSWAGVEKLGGSWAEPPVCACVCVTWQWHGVVCRALTVKSQPQLDSGGPGRAKQTQAQGP